MFTTTMPASDELYEQATNHLPGGNSRTTVYVAPHPPYLVRGEGCTLVDADGHELLDLIGNYTTLVHGHGRAEVVAAAIAAVQDGPSVSLPTRHEVDLAAELTRRMPAGERWRFANSGTEAVMMALRLARFATGRDVVVRFEGCYHGTSDAVLAPGALGVPSVLAPVSVTLPVGDPEALMDALEARGEQIACVLFDAMPSRAGLVPADPAFVELLRRETRERGILLVQDEVISFRTAVGGMQSIYGVEPDLTTLGKVIGGGYPVGAIGGRADVMDLFDPREPGHLPHGGTFSANPLTMRAGLAALQILTAQEIDRINAMGDRLREQLLAMGWNVTGWGSLLRVHAGDPTALFWQLYNEGILIAGNGLIALSTAMDDAALARAVDAFERVR